MTKRYATIMYSTLIFVLIIGFFYQLGSYPLLDIDETRYVDMARGMFNSKDYMTLYLNGNFFFEKPPLYFWIECFSFKILGTISELSARLPIVLLSLFPAGLLFSLCKKVKDEKFAIITTATLFTSLEYMFLTKIAILDSVLTSFVTSSVLCYFYTFFTEEKNKKYFWTLTYIFSALAVLSKGIPGIAIPILVIFISTIAFKTYKETIKYSWGIIIFLLITLPWHIIMLNLHGKLFFDEYIIKHHILRFLGSDVINRTQPWYFYILTLIWGLFPHIFILISKLPQMKEIRFDNKFLTLNFIGFAIVLIFFSLSGAKLITYILPAYVFSAVFIGNIWYNYIQQGNNNVKISIITLNTLLTIAVILLLFTKLVIPEDIYTPFLPIKISALAIFTPYIILNWVLIAKNYRLEIFLSLVIFMSILSGIITPLAYKFDYSFGQNDLMKFAKIAKDNNYTISTYQMPRKYSLLYYGEQSKINFQTSKNINWLNKELNKENNIIIMRNKNIKDLPVKIKEKGVKFSIVERVNYEKQ